jgi:hypothetical protein
MKKLLLSLLFVLALGFALATPAPQQITIELGKAFTLQGADTASFEGMKFNLGSVTMMGDNPQVMLTMFINAKAMNDSSEGEPLMLELPAAASVQLGDYTLTLVSASQPDDEAMSCAVSRATLILEETEKAL